MSPATGFNPRMPTMPHIRLFSLAAKALLHAADHATLISSVRAGIQPLWADIPSAQFKLCFAPLRSTAHAGLPDFRLPLKARNFAAHPGRISWLERPSANASAGTSLVITLPDPT